MITVFYNRIAYRYRVEPATPNEREEIYMVITKSGTIKVTNNRPFYLAKQLKHRARNPEWEIKGEIEIKMASFREALIKAMKDHLKY